MKNYMFHKKLVLVLLSVWAVVGSVYSVYLIITKNNFSKLDVAWELWFIFGWIGIIYNSFISWATEDLFGKKFRMAQLILLILAVAAFVFCFINVFTNWAPRGINLWSVISLLLIVTGTIMGIIHKINLERKKQLKLK